MHVVCSQPPAPYQVPLLHRGCLGSRGSHSGGVIVVVGHTGEEKVTRTSRATREGGVRFTVCHVTLNEDETRRMSFCPATTSRLTLPPREGRKKKEVAGAGIVFVKPQPRSTASSGQGTSIRTPTYPAANAFSSPLCPLWNPVFV